MLGAAGYRTAKEHATTSETTEIVLGIIGGELAWEKLSIHRLNRSILLVPMIEPPEVRSRVILEPASEKWGFSVRCPVFGVQCSAISPNAPVNRAMPTKTKLG